jgi:hypothetical protein
VYILYSVRSRYLVASSYFYVLMITKVIIYRPGRGEVRWEPTSAKLCVYLSMTWCVCTPTPCQWFRFFLIASPSRFLCKQTKQKNRHIWSFFFLPRVQRMAWGAIIGVELMLWSMSPVLYFLHRETGSLNSVLLPPGPKLRVYFSAIFLRLHFVEVG